MKTFNCSQCQQLLFFENVTCARCARLLAYLPDLMLVCPMERVTGQVVAQGDDASALWLALTQSDAAQKRYRLCRNYTEHAACNWAVAEEDDHALCRACRLTVVIPDLSDEAAKQAWRRLEAAKRRLIYTLIALRMPIESRAEGKEGGLSFEFKKAAPGGEHVITGHSGGLITINVAEADDPFREQMRTQLGEAYRTLVGHVRHEVGHYYWDRLIKDSPRLSDFRALFGDEQADYAAALKSHYETTDRGDWSACFVSAYASTHPWEDWAETFAHYLHMVDTLDTARNFGLGLRAKGIARAGLADLKAPRLDFDDFDDLITAWFPLTIALNSFNRGMGLPDLYPFVLGERTIEKLKFVHAVVEQSAVAIAAPPPDDAS